MGAGCGHGARCPMTWPIASPCRGSRRDPAGCRRASARRWSRSDRLGQADGLPEPDARRRVRAVGRRQEHDRGRARPPPPAGRPDRHRHHARAAQRRGAAACTTTSSGATHFRALRDSDGLLEWAEVHGNLYGTPIDQVRGILAAGRDAILTIDPQGARQVRARVPDALLVFVKPPTMKDLTRRLRRAWQRVGRVARAAAPRRGALDGRRGRLRPRRRERDRARRRGRRADLGHHPGRGAP